MGRGAHDCQQGQGVVHDPEVYRERELPAPSRVDCAAQRGVVPWSAALRASIFTLLQKTQLTHGLQMECAAINVSGGTGAKTPSTVSFPGAYKGEHFSL